MEILWNQEVFHQKGVLRCKKEATIVPYFFRGLWAWIYKRRTLVTTTDSSWLWRESRQSKERPASDLASCYRAAPLSNSEPLFCREAELKSRLCLDEKWNLVLWKPLSFHPNKSLPWITAFPKLWSITRRECNVFDMRLLQIPKVTHVSVSAKLLVAKLDWGPLLIFEPKVAKYRSMDLVFGIIQRSNVKDASFYSLQHPCTLAQVTCTECQKWRNMLSWGVRLEL